ncbi:MAG: hypothetical protein M1838_003626 [Thelocarpon superellum]|nr:MAG: hypothetical protein M1838_003626 [Thelocarpon superellum]
MTDQSTKLAGTGLTCDDTHAPSSSSTQAPATNATTATDLPRGDVEASMRQFLGQMRHLQTQDPSLFTQVWEQVQKATPEADPSLQGQQRPFPLEKAIVGPDGPSRPPLAQQSSATSPAQPSGAAALQSRAEEPLRPAATPSHGPQDGSEVKPIEQFHVARWDAPRRPTDTALTPSTGVPRSQPTVTAVPSRPGPGTFWPEAQRESLAHTAASTLRSNPANAGKAVSPQMITALLERNPSYVELCEWLEADGFAIDRRSFARSLIAALSAPRPITATGPVKANTAAPRASIATDAAHLARSLSGKTQGASEQASPPRPLDRRPSNPAPERFQFTADVHQRMINRQLARETPMPSTSAGARPATEALTQVDATTAHFSGSQGAGPPMASRPSHVNVRVYAEADGTGAAPAKVSTKAEAARKRNFSDIVDLTTEHPDYAEGPSVPPAPLHSDVGVPGELAVMTHPLAPMAMASSQGHGAPLPSRDLKGRQVVHRLDWDLAVRRSAYDPKTIAHDVLIATGRHPRARGLNEHLAMLKQSFGSVKNDADLSTFRWTLVDPGTPDPRLLPVESHGGDSSLPGADTTAVNSITTPVTGSPDVLHTRGSPTRGRGTGRGQGSVRARNRGRGGLMATQTPRSLPLRDLDPTSPAARLASSQPQQAVRPSAKFAVVINGRPPPAAQLSYIEPKTPVSREVVPATTTPIYDGALDEPSYTVFSCRWKHCRAKLHNLETLRKHLTKVHCVRAAHGGFPCAWKGCGRVTTVVDAKKGRSSSSLQPMDFNTEEGWDRHMEKTHLDKYAWKLGDGPSTGPAGALPPAASAYLGLGLGYDVTARSRSAAASQSRSG